MFKKSIEDALAAFKFRDLQSFRTLVMTLEQNGLSIDDAMKYVELRVRLKTSPYTRPCPKCKEGAMDLYPVNDSPCTQIGGKYKSQWFCRNIECNHSILSKKSLLAESRKWLKKRKDLSDDTRRMAEWNLSMQNDDFAEICPKCKKREYRLIPITIPKGKANVHGWKTLWWCDACGHERYRRTTIEQELARLRRI